jgi:F-type H+-transporting ATPase subunit a
MTDPAHIAEHVADADKFELPFKTVINIWQPFEAWGLPLHLTKFMVLQLIVAVLMLLIFIPLARKLASGAPPRGKFANIFEAMLLFLRNEVVRPSIGRAEVADRYLPLIWTLFFYILFCNLLGIVPYLGSATGAVSTTMTLAIIAFVATIFSGMRKFGVAKFWLGLCPHIDVGPGMKIFLVPMIWVIELLGLLIKHTILAVRLLANMFAGHLVLAFVLYFIVDSASSMLWYGITPASVFGATALNLLELFVAFLQAYIFVFLTSVFIGMSLHQH